MATTWADPGRHLLLVSKAAAGNGLSTYDLQSGRLFDCTDARPVELETEADLNLAWVSPQVLREALDEIERGDHHYLILSDPESHQTYAQTYFEEGSWQVEYRDGSPADHFQADTSSRAETEAFLWAWVSEQEGWADLLGFQHVSL